MGEGGDGGRMGFSLSLLASIDGSVGGWMDGNVIGEVEDRYGGVGYEALRNGKGREWWINGRMGKED